MTAFIARSTESPDPEAFERYPEQPSDAAAAGRAFGRFGLPERL